MFISAITSLIKICIVAFDGIYLAKITSVKSLRLLSIIKAFFLY
jgi:hypothetical protein